MPGMMRVYNTGYDTIQLTLTFYLVETRPRKYAELLKIIAAKNPMFEYSSKDRVNDFKRVFGSNMKLMEAEFLRFMDRLN